MSDVNESISSNPDFVQIVNNLLITQIVQECQLDALKRILQNLLMQTVPAATLAAQDQAYKTMIQVILDKKLEHSELYSAEMSENIRQQLRDIPGIIMPSLRE